MKVLVLTSSFPLHPGDTTSGPFVEAFCRALVEQGHEVTVVTQDRPGRDKRPPAGMAVRWFAWKGPDRPLAYLKPWRPRDLLAIGSLLRNGRSHLRELLQQERFDHVFAMWAVPAGWFARDLKRRHGLPVTVWCLGSDIWTYGRYPLLRQVVASVLRETDLLYADGFDLCKRTEELGGRPCAFLPTSRRLDQNLRQPVGVPGREHGVRFLFIGRYALVKGVDVLLAAMRLYLQQGGRGHLFMFGGGPSAGELRRLAAEPELRDHVTVGGFADESTCVSYLSACDVAIIPSRMESIPVALSDALQLGLPAIVSNVGDMGTLVEQYQAGIVVPPENVEALAAAMRRFSQSPIDAWAPGVRTLASEFDVGRAAEQWAQVAVDHRRGTSAMDGKWRSPRPIH